MRTNLRALLIGVAIPIGLHFLAQRGEMPWWPDVVSLGIGFGVFAVIVVSKTRTDREISRRLWNALKDGRNRTR